jgi:ABC-type sugar transport system substrate-binding protein
MADPSKPSSGRFAKWLGILVVIFGAAGVGYWLGIQTDETPAPEPGVVLFRHNQRSESTEQREQGFLDTMQKEFPEVRILTSLQHLGTTRSSSVLRSRQVIDDVGDAITGIFCVNEPNTDGCLQTLEETDRAGTITFVGFDTTPAMLAALKQGKMAGIILQDPMQMGYEAVNTALAHLRGETVEKLVTTRHHLVTADNLESDELRPYVYPERFSGARFTPENTEFTIGVVTKGLSHDFWQSVRAGVEKAARESGNTLIRFEAPVLEQDVEGQIKIVRQLIADKVSAICLVPIDSEALGEVVVEADKAGVPVVIFDSGLDAEKTPEAAAVVVSYVATDNYEAGATAARRLAAVLKETSSTN